MSKDLANASRHASDRSNTVTDRHGDQLTLQTQDDTTTKRIPQQTKLAQEGNADAATQLPQYIISIM